jgi:hypothetical protein
MPTCLNDSAEWGSENMTNFHRFNYFQLAAKVL